VTTKRTLLIVLLAGVMFCSCGPPLGRPSRACDARRHSATLVTRYIIVYGTHTGREASTTYYTCLRPAGVSVKLGIDELGSVYGSDATTGGFSAAGTYVAAQSSTGTATAAVCARYNSVRRCSRARCWITLIDAKTRRRAHVPIYATLPVPALVRFPVTVAVSAKGAVAWLETSTAGTNTTGRLQLWATTLEPRGRSGYAAVPSMIDAGSIDPASVRFHGRTLRWVRGREQHHKQLS
jgi:hypothetical protein